MTNYLEKEKVRYWSRIVALLLTLAPVVVRYYQGRNLLGFLEGELGAKVVMLMILLLIGLVSYGVNYYVVSSLFWPEKLGIGEKVLMVIGGSGLVVEVREIGKMLLEKK